MAVKCTWTLCQYCKNVKDKIEGECGHPNGSEAMVKEGDIRIVGNSMVYCEQYSSKEW